VRRSGREADGTHGRRVMAPHRYAVGQFVRLSNRHGLSAKAAETYRVTRTLPERNNSPQYRIRSEAEQHERVATEDILEPADAPEDPTAAS
jgi:hypothetical protein